jgi:hypothetical protein
MLFPILLGIAVLAALVFAMVRQLIVPLMRVFTGE